MCILKAHKRHKYACFLDIDKIHKCFLEMVKCKMSFRWQVVKYLQKYLQEVRQEGVGENQIIQINRTLHSMLMSLDFNLQS